jgi:hypothetical protein
MDTSKKGAENIRVGDTIKVLSEVRRVTAVEPYNHPTIPEVFAIAKSGEGWGITLTHGMTFEVYA